MNQVGRVMCSGAPPASRTTAAMFRKAWRICATKSWLSNCWSAFHPTWPATEIVRPSAAMPFAVQDWRHQFGSTVDLPLREKRGDGSKQRRCDVCKALGFVRVTVRLSFSVERKRVHHLDCGSDGGG